MFPAPAYIAEPVDPRIQVHRLQTSDGETLIVWRGPDPAPGCPYLIFFHGNGSHLSVERWRHGRIMDAGLGLIAPAYRGYSGSSGTPGEAGLMTDARQVHDWALQGGVSADMLVVQGHSMGSGVAVALAAELTVGALVLEAPFLSLLAMVRRQMPILPVDLLLKHRFRSDERMGSVTAPILIAHGSQDRLIPPSQSKALHRLAGDGAEYVVMPGSDHNTMVRDGLYEDIVWPYLAGIYENCEGLR